MEGKLLHRPAAELDGRWALLPFCLVQDLRPVTGCELSRIEAAREVALAMECIGSATDLLDDVMDSDATPLIEQLGEARALSVALALISLAHRMLLALLDLDLPVMLPKRLMETVQSAILRASAGQQQDLLAEGRPASELSCEECLEIASAKAGALLALACQMGALCAGLADEQVARCAEAGRLLGIAAQLDNDAHDLSELLQPADQRNSQKSDLARGKKTLPIVLAARSLQITYALEKDSIDFRYLELLKDSEREKCFGALREGILTTWGIALLYRERAREAFGQLVGVRFFSPALCRVLGLNDALEEIKDW
jgi:geranylgeranyl pyrophosphate synthase